MIKNKRVLVTGGAGFIGSHVVDKLVKLGNNVICVDNECAKQNDKFYWNPEADNYKYDILNYDLIESLFNGVDYVFHLAARARIQPTINDPAGTIKTNINGTLNCLEAASRYGVKRFIYSSTSSYYGVANKPPLSEDMKRDCLNPYSVSKVASEDLCKVYNSLYNLETVTLRYFNVYGDRHPTRGEYAPVVGLFMEQVRKGKKMTIVGDGEQRRDFTYIKDVVDANILAATCDDKDKSWLGTAFNIGTGVDHSINDISAMIADPEFHAKKIPARPAEARTTLADNTKAKNVLGWNPTVMLPDWVKYYWDRENKRYTG